MTDNLDEDQIQTTREIYQLYRNPNSDLYLQQNTEAIYQAAKREGKYLTRAEIETFKHSVESTSRNFEARVLRSRKRHLSYRKWLSFSPLHILSGDLLFLRLVKPNNNKKYVVLILQDVFSKMVKLTPINSTSSKDTLKAFEQSLIEFGADQQLQGRGYRHLAVDRG